MFWQQTTRGVQFPVVPSYRPVYFLNSLRPSDAYMRRKFKTTNGSDSGLSTARHDAIIWNNAGIVLIAPLGTNFNIRRNLCIFIQENAVENVVWKMTAILSRPQFLKWHSEMCVL